MATVPLKVQISADLADLKQGLGLARSEIASLKTAGANAGKGMGLIPQALNDIKALLPEIGLAAAAYEMASIAKEAFSAAENIGKLAQKTGATTQVLSALRVAAHGNAEEFDLIGSSLEQLAKHQDKAASGDKDAIDSFKRLGVAMDDVKSKNPGDLLVELAQKFADLPDGAEKTALAIKLFGKSGAELIPVLLELANGGFEEARKKARALGLELDQNTTDAASAADEALGDLKLQAEGLATSFLSKLAPAVVTSMSDIQQATEGDGVNAMEILGQAAAGVIQTIVSVFVGVGEIIGASIAIVVNGASILKDAAADVFSFDFSAANKRLRLGLDSQKAIVLSAWDDLKAEGAKVFDAFAGNTRLAPKPVRPPGGGTAGAGKALIKGIVDEAALAQAAIKAELVDLQSLFDRHLVSIADYYAKKKSLQERDIDAQIAQAQADAKAATSSEQQSKALTKIIELQHERERIGPQLAIEQAKAEQDLADKLADVRDQLLEINGQQDVAALDHLHRQYRELFAQLTAEGNQAGIDLLNGLINDKAAEAKLAALKERLSNITGGLNSVETSLGAQVGAGLIPHSTAEEQLQALRAKSLEQLKALRIATAAYLATMSVDSPEGQKAIQLLQQIDTQLAEVTAAQNQFKGQIKDQAVSSLSGFFTDLATGAKSFKDAFKDMVRNFVAGIAQMIAQKLALKAVDAIFTAFGWHSGGLVTEGGATFSRSINPMVFGAAPRYHSGGIAGLAPGEMPAILQRGEEVLTRNDPRHVANLGRGGSAPQVTKVNVFFNADDLADAMAGPAGERVVVAHVRNNGRKLGTRE